ncbi:cell division protein FtsB [Litorivicinus lipolyticus]|uniref:Cell division protein FtsB n=1 Tax=Litorivicinus lipolyticus TaxID=418701 RepID=A0A5Q2Q6Q3_9GAMM|nr:septum formation initiator family protein [Litorivicinus lipolyticus]QGG79979.1 cell division protein FtsB [Litorivicinus lipolyticus]
MRNWVWLILLGLFALLQYKWWLGQGGLLEQAQLRGRVAEQADKIATLEAENNLLRREVRALNTEQGLEEAARVHLGVKRADEVYIRIAPGAAQ